MTADDYPFQPQFGNPVTDWYRWFAWHPVATVDRGWRWLVVVNRRRVAKYSYLIGGHDFWFQHVVTIRTPKEKS